MGKSMSAFSIAPVRAFWQRPMHYAAHEELRHMQWLVCTALSCMGRATQWYSAMT